MKKISNFVFILLISSIKLNAQNANIVYQVSNLCTSCCNVFNQSGSSTIVGGYNHYPVSGGAAFDGTNVKMLTQFDATNNKNTGTAYAIGYTFKTGYNYIINIDAGYTASPPTAFPRLRVSLRSALPLPGDSDPLSCGAVSSNKYLNSIGDVIKDLFVSPQAIQTYTVSHFQLLLKGII